MGSMWFLVLVSLLSRPSEADLALDVLARCTTPTEEPCIIAATHLKILGAAAYEPLGRRIDELGAAGQLLVMSVLGDTRDPAVDDLVHGLAKGRSHDPTVRVLALEALAKRRDPRAAKLAQVMLDDKEPLLRQAAVRALATVSIGAPKKQVALLVRASRDKAPGVRAEVAFALGFCNCKEAGPLLTKALADPAAEVRHAAAEGLCFVKHAPAIPALVPLLRDGNDLVLHAAGRALRFQTELDLGDDPAAWEAHLARRAGSVPTP